MAAFRWGGMGRLYIFPGNIEIQLLGISFCYGIYLFFAGYLAVATDHGQHFQRRKPPAQWGDQRLRKAHAPVEGSTVPPSFQVMGQGHMPRAGARCFVAIQAEVESCLHLAQERREMVEDALMRMAADGKPRWNAPPP